MALFVAMLVSMFACAACLGMFVFVCVFVCSYTLLGHSCEGHPLVYGSVVLRMPLASGEPAQLNCFWA